MKIARSLFPLLLLLLGGALGVAVGLLREGNPVTAALMWAEPLPAVVGIAAVHLCFSSGRGLWGLACAATTAAFLLSSRLLPSLPPALVARSAVPAGVDACVPEVPESLILTHWRGANDAAVINALVDQADVLILSEPALDPADLWSEPDGELMFARDDLWVWARAGFAACGDADRWAVGRLGVLVFAAPTAATAVPLFISTLPSFGDALHTEAGALADAALTLGNATAVVIADADFPTSYRHTDLRLASAGQRSIALPPNAPNRLGPLPFLTLRPTVKLWAGSAWQGRGRAQAADTLHTPVVIRLDLRYQTP